MKRLRIAHLVQHFAEGEIELMVSRLAQGTLQHGIENVVIAHLGDGPLRAELEAKGVRTLLLQAGAGGNAHLPARLAALLVQEQVHALHTHHVGSFAYGATAAHMLGLPLVHTEHDQQLYATVRVRGAYGRRSLPGAVPGESALLGGAGDLSMRTVMIANGIPLRTRPTRYERAHVRAQLALPDQAFVFASVARWSSQGEAAQLVEAFARTVMLQPQALLLMACDGSTRTALSARAESLGLGARVRFLGQPESIASWLPAADALVLNSGHTQIALEAMAACVPVIATAVGGLPSLLRNGAGAVLGLGDLVGVAQTMAAFASSPWLCDAYATLARVRVEADHSLAATALAYAVLYRAACAEPRVGREESVRCVVTN